MTRLRNAILTGLASALLAGLFVATPIAHRIENQYALGLLYRIRGELAPPEGAAVIAIDRETMAALRETDAEADTARLLACVPESVHGELDQIRGPSTLPRAVHGCLLEELGRLGVPVVSFDIVFAVPGDHEDDLAFAEALEGHSAAVVLVGFERSVIRDGESELLIEREVQPLALFRDAAAASGAFVVPRSGGPVYGYWPRLPGFEHVGSLPEEAFRLWRSEPSGAAQQERGSAFEYFWLYGPPGSIETISAIDVLTGRADARLGAGARAAVFIGASDPMATNFPDAFPSFFQGGSGADISGVELAATAFLNIMHQERLRRMPAVPALVITVLFAGALGFLAKVRSGAAIIAVPVAAIVGLTLAAWAFAEARLFFPVGAPLFLAAPAIFLLAVVIRYRFARALIMHLAPAPVARRMLAQTSEDRGAAVSDEATIVFFDLIGSTAIAEKIPAVDFSNLLNAYHETITRGVGKERGFVSAFSGDGVLAVFTLADAGKDHAARACRSVISVIRGIAGVNAGNVARGMPPLKLRVGVNSGSVAEGDIGAPERFNFSVVGDVVNLAARLEQLGKSLFPGESEVILVGSATRKMAGGAGLSFVDCGQRAIPGREQPENLYRLVIE